MRTTDLLFPLLLLAVSAAGAEPVVRESSGLALGSGGLVWTQNDGPNPGERQDRNLYAFAADGTLVRAARLDVRNDDWEDLASFIERGKRYLLVADTGDNLKRRSESQIYVVEEPKGEQAIVAWKIRFRYSDGPRDCEAVAVDRERSRILLLTKREEAPGLYVLPLHPAEGMQTAARIGSLRPLPRSSLVGVVFHPVLSLYDHEPTAMDISPDQRKLVVLTYRRAYLWVRKGKEPWETALARDPDQWISLPETAQYEGVAFSSDGRAILVSQEGKDGYEKFPL
jgi:hypothetical protein